MQWGKNKDDPAWGEWRDYYAWYPVDMDNGTVVWLDTVERRGKFDYGAFMWEYRLKKPVVITDKT